ncbi:MAG: SH3 domain-containing protein [Hyphomicrobiaceae bacterium]
MTMQHRIAPLIFALFLLVSVGTSSPSLAQGGGGAPPAAPDDGGPRTWQVVKNVNLREQPSTRSDVLTKYKAGELLSNLGCRSAEGRAWCDVQKIRGGKRGFVAAEFIKPAIGPDGAAAEGPDDSALRAGQGKFDATGRVPCAAASGQPMGQCEFGVARAGGGYATVVVNRPDGRKRALYFTLGIAVSADTSEAEGERKFSASKKSDLHLIEVGPERYEIPDAVILGG